MEVYLIRHGRTPGNLAGRYVGRTDEPLSPEGEAALRSRGYPAVDRVYASPMLRCLGTAEILYPGCPPRVREGFRELDFGEFEGKGYDQLKDLEAYRLWIGAGGRRAAPGGEDPEAFRARCCAAFEEALLDCLREGVASVAFLLHGGVVMAVMDRFAASDPARSFYDWQVPNGEGWAVRTTLHKWVETKTLLGARRL